MKSLLVVVGLVFTCVPSAMAQTAPIGPDGWTYGKINGRTWRSLPDVGKIMYLTGAAEGGPERVSG